MPLLNFSDSFFEGEERSGFYVEPLMKRAWAAQLEVLEQVKVICKRHNIPYFTDFGTTLGAVRHKGYIPWDDDLDTTMLRNDLMKFIRIAKNELPKGYKVINCHDFEGHDQVICRVVNGFEIRVDDEFLKEFHGCPFAVGIDLFPLDNVPDDPEERELQKNLITIVKGALEAHMPGSEATDEEKEILLNNIRDVLGKTFDKNADMVQQIEVLLDALSAMYSEEKTECVGIPYRLTYLPESTVLRDRSWYSDTVELPFEITTVSAPIGYENYLRTEYGENYMTPLVYPGHDYPFYKGQYVKLKAFLEENGTSLAAFGIPKMERENLDEVVLK